MGRVTQGLLAAVLVGGVIATVAAAGGDGDLAKAVNAGDVQTVRALIKSGTDVNAKSGDGSTPLLWAPPTSTIATARPLAAPRASADPPTDFGLTPLLEASRNGDAPMVELLLRAGAGPKRAHPDGETPLLTPAPQ